MKNALEYFVVVVVVLVLGFSRDFEDEDEDEKEGPFGYFHTPSKRRVPERGLQPASTSETEMTSGNQSKSVEGNAKRRAGWKHGLAIHDSAA